jgi:hypothetical protein
MRRVVEFIVRKESQQDGQNGYPTRPQPTVTPQAYPLGYVEDVAKVRTPLGIVFTILLNG